MALTVAVIAANGRSGMAFVRKALEAGYKVRAGIHGVSTLPTHEHMQIVQCDATSESDIRTLLQGADVVVSLMGHGKNSPARVQTNAMKVVANVMDELGIHRIISLTGTGVRLPGDTPNLIDILANVAIKFIDKQRIADGIAHAEFLRSTDLDWTIIRVLKLCNSTRVTDIRFSLHGPAQLLSSREHVADAIIKIISENSYIRQAPILAG